MPDPNEEARITLRLSPSTKEALDEIIRLGGFKTIQDAVRRAIGDEVFLQRQIKGGWSVMLKKEGEYRELVWPN